SSGVRLGDAPDDFDVHQHGVPLTAIRKVAQAELSPHGHRLRSERMTVCAAYRPNRIQGDQAR
ncbi:MAG: hypothetical protein AAF848_08235, partial [Pseudomonadota bacterium]